MTMKKATHAIDDYTIVIPHAQNLYNLYNPEKLESGWWQFGIKYQSGVFEYFQYPTKAGAEISFLELTQAIDVFYSK